MTQHYKPPHVEQQQQQQQPIVLEVTATSQLINFLITNHAEPTRLIVCSTRDIFVQHLLDELAVTAPPPSTPRSGQHNDDDDDDGKPKNQFRRTDRDDDRGLSTLLTPTLSLLATSRTIKLSYCPDLIHLLAHLSQLSSTMQRAHDSTQQPPPTASSAGRPILALLNPIRLHKPTSSFSAQGLNRTFAAAVETAHVLGMQLVVCESPDPPDHVGPLLPLLEQQRGRDEDAGPERDTQGCAGPWDHALSMLNVTTRTFGVGERGWVGRTVPVRRVAERWCTFVRLDHV